MMKIDSLFVGGGGLALGLALQAIRRRSRGEAGGALLWVGLAAGLLLQGFSPHLKTEQDSFVVPPPSDPTSAFDPKKIVDREPQMNLYSAVLTGTAAVGLLIRHRSLFTNSPRP